MSKENECCSDCKHVIVKNKHYGHGNSDAIYGLGVVGALFYFLPNATNLTAVLWGIGKAIFWPAILMYKLLGYLNM